MTPPDIHASTREDRRAFVIGRYPCIANCEACGLCKLFRGQDAEIALADYIDGRRPFEAVMRDYKGTRSVEVIKRKIYDKENLRRYRQFSMVSR